MKFKMAVNNFKEKSKSFFIKFKNSENKKNIVFMAIGAITLIAVTLGATYAYFTAQSGGGANIDTDVITGTTDLISFSFGSEINIQANEENFGQGMGNLSDSTTAQALLRANNTTNSVTTRYNIYLVIESNNFEYTTENGTPEILLNVTDPNGNKVENITGLVHYENGFDITTRTGGYLLVPDYEISATNVQTIQDWNIEVTFVNLDSDQNANTNKTLTGKLYLTQDKMSSYELTQISNIETSTTYNSIDATLDITNGSAAVSKYYYGIEKASEVIAYNTTNSIKKLSSTLASAEDVEYIESDTPNYEFTNLEANTEYTIYSYVEDENKIKSNVYSTNITTSEYEIPTVDSVSHSVTLNSITLNVTASGGSNNVTKYMYSKDNGLSWEESTSNSYTFDNLTDSTEYKIKVKVVDSEGVESTEYYEAITTEIYILPVVASVDATTTWNSITLTPSGTNGTNAIDHYEYSIDNGAYQTSNVFNNLTDNKEYTIRVKAIDSAGRESNVYETTVTTDAYKLPVINNVTFDSTQDSITINVNATGGDGSIVSYHYSRDDGSNYQTSNNTSYTFNNLTGNTTFYIKVYVTDSNGRTSSEYSTSVATEAPIYLNDYIVNTLYTGTDGDNGLYYHEGVGSYENANLEADDNSYRYSGANPNNYVCFGSDEAACPVDNLYRIIGVFDGQVKLIKYDYVTKDILQTNGAYFGNDGIPKDSYKGSLSTIPWYKWGNSNTWTESELNTINLNTNYLSSIEDLKDYIVETEWQVGGGSASYLRTGDAKTAFEHELGANSENEIYRAKIGLMYLSDYYYAANPKYWSYQGASSTSDDYSNATNENWMYMGGLDWTISRDSSSSSRSYNISWQGYVNTTYVTSDNGIRPVVNLKETVYVIDGDGSQADPYIIGM